MTSRKQATVRTAAELSTGDEIEAWHNGRLFHRGPVLRVLPSMGLFWIQDGRTGARRLLDVEALDIVRADARRGTTGGRDTPDREPNMLWFSSSS
jgi:hypothetical protein